MKLSLEQVKDRMKELRDEECGRTSRKEDFEDYSKFYEGESKLRWIWRKGANLGKKMVVTGVVISSAPFILPPLMALSAIGFAFSLPTWFGLATYVCTDKLMNTLLPIPSRSSYVELGPISSDEGEYRVGNNDEVDQGYEEDDEGDIGFQEKELEDDTRKEFEKGVELGEEKDRDASDDHSVELVSKDEQDTQMPVPEIVEEGGYEEDVGEYIDAKEQYMDTTAIRSTMSGTQEAENDISLIETEGVEMPKHSLSTSVIEEEISGRRENDGDQLLEELAFVPARGAEKDFKKDGNFADISYVGITNETTRLLDGGGDDLRQQDSLHNDKCTENDQGITIQDMPQEKGQRNLSVIPEELKPSGNARSENLNHRDVERGDNLAGIGNEELGNETIGLLEQIRDECRDDHRRQGSIEKGKCEENKQKGGIAMKDILQEKGIKENENLSVIPEEIKPAGYVRSENIIKAVDERGEKSENLAGIGDEELRNETIGLLERIRDESRDDHIQKGSLDKVKRKESEQNRGIAIADMPQEKEQLSVIPEEAKLASYVRSENLNETVDVRAEKGNEAEIALEQQSEILIERMTVVNVKTSGDHTATDVRQGTVLDENMGTLILSSVAAVEIANESGFDDETVVSHKLADLLNKGEGLASESVVDVSFDYHELHIESGPLSKHAVTGLDQGSTADSDKESGNDEKIWEQIHNIRTIVGYKTTPHTSYVEELKALYLFTGVEQPVSSKDTSDVEDANEKLHILMSIVGVK